MKRTKEDAQHTRDALLSAALVVFSARGFTAATLEDIAAEAQVTRGALYHHFSGKAELFDTLLTRAGKLPGQIVQQALERGGPFLEIMRRVFVQQIVVMETDSVYRATVELVMFKLDGHPHLEQVRARVSEGRQASLLLLTDALQEGVKQGVVRSNLDSSQLAVAFLSLQIGFFHVWNSNPEGMVLEQSAQTLAEVLISGIRA